MHVYLHSLHANCAHACERLGLPREVFCCSQKTATRSRYILFYEVKIVTIKKMLAKEFKG